MRFSRTPLLVRALFFFVIALPLATPVNFVVIQPGEGAPLFPKVLQLTQGFEEKIETYKPNGQMFLLSIWVSNPDAKVLGAEIVQCWVRSDCAVIPRSKQRICSPYLVGGSYRWTPWWFGICGLGF